MHDDIQSLDISLNIDGLPLFRSTRTTVWPILCALHLNPVSVFPITLTLGKSKPNDLEFIEDTIQCVSALLQHGLEFDNRLLQVNLRCVVCDAPARAMVKSIKQYSGYYGCERCTQKGRWAKKIIYPQITNLNLRTDHSFRTRAQEEHHKPAMSPFCNLPIDMITKFSIDYMHQSCLGVMKILLLLWLRGKKEIKMAAIHVAEVSRRSHSIKEFIPNAFARKPRGMEELDYWKATEFRQFLLYTGKYVLKGILRPELYDHFMTLNVALGIMVCPSLAQDHRVYAHELLTCFVGNCEKLYGEGVQVKSPVGLLIMGLLTNRAFDRIPWGRYACIQCAYATPSLFRC